MASRREVRRELEWRRCATDPIYFLENYWTIQVIGKGYGKFNLRDYQHKDATSMHGAIKGEESNRQIRLKARQIGWTTLATGIAFWDAYFHNDHPWLIASQGQDEASATLATKIKAPYLSLPLWMRKRGPQLLNDNKEVMEFGNNSSIISIPSTSSAGRSKAVFGVLMDEAAFVENAEELFAALDPLCYGPLFIFSTANGMGNFFHETWLESQLPDSVWEGAFRPWHDHPDRDEGWYNNTKLKYRGKEHLFYQEYPATPSEAFMKSGNTAFDLEILQDKHWCPPQHRYDLTLMHRIEGKDFANIVDAAEIHDPTEDRAIELHVWQLPYLERYDNGRLRREPNFIVGVDTSEGLEDGDYSALAVFDVNAQEYVATMKAHVPIDELGRIAEMLGYWYYTALVVVERNNTGLVPLQYLQTVRYPRLYRMDTIAQIKMGDRSARYGWHTNRATKPKMVIEMAKEIRDDVIVFHDQRFQQEAGTFLADGKGGFGATPGNHDDLIMAKMIAHQGSLDVGMYPTLWQDPEPGPPTMGEVLSLGMPKPTTGYALAQGIGQKKKKPTVVPSFEMLQR